MYYSGESEMSGMISAIKKNKCGKKKKNTQSFNTVQIGL